MILKLTLSCIEKTPLPQIDHLTKGAIPRGGPGRAGAGLVDLVHVCEPWTRLPPGHAWFPLGALWAWQHGDRCEDTTVVADSEVESECPI